MNEQSSGTAENVINVVNVENPEKSDNTDHADNVSTRRDRAALGWFSLGVLVGAVAAIGLLVLTGAAHPAATGTGTVDLNSIREAARQGAQDALLTANTGVTEPISLSDIRDAARQGAQDAISNGAQADTGNGQAPAPTPAPVDMAAIKLNPNNTEGPANATVTFVEYADFQCPYCKRFNDTVLPQIINDYVKTGKMKFTYKHYAFLGDESRWAAEAAECAANQGKFWDFHDLLFARQMSENGGAFTKNNLIVAAKEVKMDNAKFADCLNQDKTLDRVQADTNEGNKIGVRGTPSFLINGKLIVGAQPYEAFKTAIDAALKP
jgi:protein-disulfide isomerase